RVDPKTQVVHRDLVFDAITDAVDALILETGEMQHRFPHGLAGNGTGIEADASHNFTLLDYSHSATAFGYLNRGALAGEAGAAHNHVVSSDGGRKGPKLAAPRRPRLRDRRERIGWSYFPALKRSSIASQLTTFHQAPI